MKPTQLIESRFRGVYIGLLLIWFAASVGLSLVIDSWFVPQVVANRVSAVEALIHSHHKALLYNDHRALRDELLGQGIISDDRNFDEYWLDQHGTEVRALVGSCKFITDSACVAATNTLFFNSPAKLGLKGVSFAISLKTTYFDRIEGVRLWKAAGTILLGLLLGIAIWAIRRQEKFLIQKIGLLVDSQSKIESLFQLSGECAEPSLDEFDLISQGIDQAAAMIKERTEQIEEYKRKFEKKTELEQLARTISYSSHNLKAPFLEGIDFFRNFPDYLEHMPREKLLRMTSSLERRFHEAADSLQKALSTTRESYNAPQRVSVNRLLGAFRNDVKDHPKYDAVRIDIDSRFDDGETIFCSAHDMNAALWNLLNNAVELKSDARIQIEASIDSGLATIRFHDNGPGIAPALLDRVFDDFYSTKLSGTGLGLGSVRNTVQKYSGTILALPSESGALFEIRLPLIDSTREVHGHA